jgi:hypothetical protein
MMMMMMMMIPKQQFSSPKLQQSLSTTKTPKNEYKKDNKKEEEKNNSSPEELSSSSSSLSSLLSSLSSLLSLSLSDVLCGVKIFQRSLTKNSATNSLGYTTLTSYPALSLLFCFYPKSLLFISPSAYTKAHIREVKKSEREFREREIERERECVYLLFFFF